MEQRIDEQCPEQGEFPNVIAVVEVYRASGCRVDRPV